MRIGITGHQTIPFNAAVYVRDAINNIVEGFSDGLVGVSSLAAGADQIFASAVLQMGGQLHVILPCQGYKESFSDAKALESFSRLLVRAATVETLDHFEPSEDAFLDAGHRVVELSHLLLAVWDGKAAKGKGGTGDIVRYARNRHIEVLVIWPPDIKR